MTESGSVPRIVKTINGETEAWEWIKEQKDVAKSAARHEQRQQERR